MSDEIAAGAGAELSVGEHVLKAFGAFGVQLDSIDSTLKKLLADESAYQSGVLDHRVFATGAAPASGALCLHLGGPSQFRQWQVRRLVIGGLTWATAATGTANILVAATLPNPSFLGSQVDECSALPVARFYSTHQVVLHAGEQLYVEIAGGTSGQSYVVAGAVEDSPDRTAVRERVAL